MTTTENKHNTKEENVPNTSTSTTTPAPPELPPPSNTEDSPKEVVGHVAVKIKNEPSATTQQPQAKPVAEGSNKETPVPVTAVAAPAPLPVPVAMTEKAETAAIITAPVPSSVPLVTKTETVDASNQVPPPASTSSTVPQPAPVQAPVVTPAVPTPAPKASVVAPSSVSTANTATITTNSANMTISKQPPATTTLTTPTATSPAPSTVKVEQTSAPPAPVAAVVPTGGTTKAQVQPVVALAPAATSKTSTPASAPVAASIATAAKAVEAKASLPAATAASAPKISAPKVAVVPAPVPTAPKVVEAAPVATPTDPATKAITTVPLAKTIAIPVVAKTAATTTSVVKPSTQTATIATRRQPIPASTTTPAPSAQATPAAAVAAQVVTAAAASASNSSRSKKKKSGAGGSVALSGGGGGGSHEKGNAGENVGRWTAEEHRLFLQGLELHGKGWKKIASLIKTRSVVQIRTHAQKYFQKLAKARQNGEEGDVAMEGRGGVSSVASVSTEVAAQTNKRRRQTVGTKRKAIQSVVSSAVKQGKKICTAQAAAGVPNPVAPLPAVAPTLANFVLPNFNTSGSSVDSNGDVGAVADPSGSGKNSCIPSISISQGTISGPALEDSIFRFLSPAPIAPMEPQVNEVARQAGANPITVPTENPSSAPTIAGEISPTGVMDLNFYPSWTDAKDMPSWYAKGADVDALLDVADSLDWLCDSGDIHETYQAPSVEETSAEQCVTTDVEPTNIASGDLGQAGAVNNSSVSTLPHVDSNVENMVPQLPSLFDGSVSSGELKNQPDMMVSSTSEVNMNVTLPDDVGDINIDDEHLQVFENPMEEQDFVSTLLDDTNESSVSLPALD